MGENREIGTSQSECAAKLRAEISRVPTVTVPTPRRTADLLLVRQVS